MIVPPNCNFSMLKGDTPLPRIGGISSGFSTPYAQIFLSCTHVLGNQNNPLIVLGIIYMLVQYFFIQNHWEGNSPVSRNYIA